MTLENINKRLSLFGDYLKYFIHYKATTICLASDIMETYRNTGILYYNKEWAKLMSFDEWLYENSHIELVDMKSCFIPLIVNGQTYYWDKVASDKQEAFFRSIGG